ncbi:unnamed protein product [Kuraishia capsulata CBS 1993]|uniref:DUF1682 domain protein n=1 Tax=Kuraishia capsulata CBS 1993 TaxID=1382522 RepID=W6MHE6_9ASCO|nr:uncharacterized protein KUCA_T00001055001 [Kuraishia capsulata CBS 1993]CDK25088.1 unnamed protein product [Kuraishia capsulata CBS 1993]
MAFTPTPAEFAKMTILERIVHYDWKIELLALGLIVSYVVLYLIGSKYNDSKAKNWIAASAKVLDEQFALVGVASNKLYIKDDGEHYAFYASGRLNVASFTAKIKLCARHNLFVWGMETVLSFFLESIDYPEDTVTVTIDLDAEASAKCESFIWSVVSKDNMNKYRSDNYFLSLTKTVESPKLPIEYVFMAENAETTDVMYKESYKDVLKDSASFLQFLAVTDLPVIKPETLEEAQPKKKVILSIKLPKSKKDLEAYDRLLKLTLKLVDYAVSNTSFRLETSRKIKKTRETEISKIKKILDERKKEELDEKKIEEKKKLRENFSKLSLEEQKKLEKKQNEKKQRKMANKQKVRQ